MLSVQDSSGLRPLPQSRTQGDCMSSAECKCVPPVRPTGSARLAYLSTPLHSLWRVPPDGCQGLPETLQGAVPAEATRVREAPGGGADLKGRPGTAAWTTTRPLQYPLPEKTEAFGFKVQVQFQEQGIRTRH